MMRGRMSVIDISIIICNEKAQLKSFSGFYTMNDNYGKFKIVQYICETIDN